VLILSVMRRTIALLHSRPGGCRTAFEGDHRAHLRSVPCGRA